MTLAEASSVGILNHSGAGAITVTLPTPASSGKVVVVVDPLSAMSGTDTVTFGTAGAGDKIGGSTGTTGAQNLPGEIFLFFCVLTSGPVANWTSRRINTAII